MFYGWDRQLQVVKAGITENTFHRMACFHRTYNLFVFKKADTATKLDLVFGNRVWLPLFSEMSNRWLRKACHYVARYSYGVYLVHFSCIWFAFVELSKMSLAFRWAVFAAVTVVVPVALYHLVESPMIDLGRRLARPAMVRRTEKSKVAVAAP